MVINYNTCQVAHEKPVSYFYMRMNNDTGANYIVQNLNFLLEEPTGSPTLLAATFTNEDTGVVTDLKLNGGITLLQFPAGTKGILRITWENGVYSLRANSRDWRRFITSQGCKIVGNYEVPQYFMYCLFQTAINYNPRQGDIFDVAAWHPTAIQEYFLTYTWQGYRFDNLPTRQFVGIDKWNITSIGPYFLYNTLYGQPLTQISQPILDTSKWPVTSIGAHFMDNTLNQCVSLEYVNVPVLDTSKWEVSYIGDCFMQTAFYSCIKMKSIELLDTTSWNPTVDGTNLLSHTLGSFYGVEYVTLRGGLYSGIYGPLGSNSMGVYDSQVKQIRVDPDLISVYQSSPSWSDIDDSKFIGW